MKSYRAIDDTATYTKSYFGAVFLRGEELKKLIPLKRWLPLTLIELMFGSELIESFVTTGSVAPYRTIAKDDSLEFGEELHLNIHVPSGFFTNLFRAYLVDVLYFKYCLQYFIIEPVGAPYEDKENRTFNCTRTRFRAQKNRFNQLIAFRRVYDLSWLFFNLAIDLVVYSVSKSIEVTVLVALSIEAFRRVLRI